MHEQSFQVSVASSRIADGHVAITLLLLSAITAYLLRGKNIQALATEARGGRLGDKFATWMVQNEDKLRKHPKLQPQQNNRSAGEPESAALPPPKKKTEPTKPKGMPQKKVPCFKTNDLPKSKVPEFDRQLTGQETGLNNLSVDEYVKGREMYSTARDPKVARQARVDYQEDLQLGIEEDLVKQGVSPKQAKLESATQAADKMKTLAALHNPDLVAGGKDVIGDFGDRKVNSRIGAQWPSRVSELDEAAKKIPEAERSKVKMNAKLERCK